MVRIEGLHIRAPDISQVLHGVDTNPHTRASLLRQRDREEEEQNIEVILEANSLSAQTMISISLTGKSTPLTVSGFSSLRPVAGAMGCSRMDSAMQASR